MLDDRLHGAAPFDAQVGLVPTWITPGAWRSVTGVDPCRAGDLPECAFLRLVQALNEIKWRGSLYVGGPPIGLVDVLLAWRFRGTAHMRLVILVETTNERGEDVALVLALPSDLPPSVAAPRVKTAIPPLRAWRR